MALHRKEFSQPAIRARNIAAIRVRQRRLAWHIFWLTAGIVLGICVTFLTNGIWLHISVLATGAPAYGQEVTDFLKAF